MKHIKLFENYDNNTSKINEEFIFGGAPGL